MHFLQKCYQNLVRNVRHCNKFAKFAILVQTCTILAKNAKLTRISEEFCKICDSCNLGPANVITLHWDIHSCSETPRSRLVETIYRLEKVLYKISAHLINLHQKLKSLQLKSQRTITDYRGKHHRQTKLKFIRF